MGLNLSCVVLFFYGIKRSFEGKSYNFLLNIFQVASVCPLENHFIFQNFSFTQYCFSHSFAGSSQLKSLKVLIFSGSYKGTGNRIHTLSVGEVKRCKHRLGENL